MWCRMTLLPALALAVLLGLVSGEGRSLHQTVSAEAALVESAADIRNPGSSAPQFQHAGCKAYFADTPADTSVPAAIAKPLQLTLVNSGADAIPSPYTFSIAASLLLTAVSPDSQVAQLTITGNNVSLQLTVAAKLPTGLDSSYFQPVAFTLNDSPCTVILAPSPTDVTSATSKTGAAIESAATALKRGAQAEAVSLAALTTADGQIVDVAGNLVTLRGISKYHSLHRRTCCGVLGGVLTSTDSAALSLHSNKTMIRNLMNHTACWEAQCWELQPYYHSCGSPYACDACKNSQCLQASLLCNELPVCLQGACTKLQHCTLSVAHTRTHTACRAWPACGCQLVYNLILPD